MSEQLEEYMLACTRGLEGDPALRQRVMQEIGGHLEESVEEGVASGKPREAACGEALKRMGDAEELGRELTAANEWRLSRRARLRRLVWWLLGPMLLAGLALCVDWRLAEWYAMYASTFSTEGVSPRLKWIVERLEPSPKGTEEARLLAKVHRASWRGDEDGYWAAADELGRRFPQDRCYAAERLLVAMSLPRSWRLAHEAEVSAALAAGRAADPDNALWDYAEAWLLASREGLWSRVRKEGEAFDKGKDPAERAALAGRLYAGSRPEAWAEMLRLVRAGLAKELRYSRAEFRRRLAQAVPASAHSVEGLLQRRRQWFSASWGWEFALRHLGRLMRLEAARPGGDTAWGREWRRFLPQLLKNLGGDEFMLWAVKFEARHDLAAAQAHGDAESAARLKEMLERLDAFEAERIRRQFVVPRPPSFGIVGTYNGEYTAEELRPQHELSLLVLDKCVLAVFAAGVLVWIACLAVHLLLMWCCGEGRPFLVLMPWRNWLRLALFGLLPPLLLYLAWNAFAPLNGREAVRFSVQQLGTLKMFLLNACWLWVVLPLWFSWVCRRELRRAAEAEGFPGGRLSAPTRALLALICWVAMLAAVGLVLCPIHRLAERRLMARLTAAMGDFPSPGVPRQEMEFVEEAGKRMLETITK
jgi:hypothetical protein